MKKITVLSMLLVLAMMFCACGSENSSSDKSSEEANVKISTPYVDLKVTESIDENVSHEETDPEKEPYTITFKSKKDDTELFSLVFNGEGKYLFGTLVGEDKNTVIYYNMPALDEDSDNYEQNRSYQEKLKEILNGLTADYEIILNEKVDHKDTSNFDIKTSVVTLKYPNKWKDKVKVEVVDNTVKFTNDKTPVFDLVFKKCDGYLLGTYKETPIYIVEYPVKTDEQAAMQQDVNVILKYLMKDPNFQMNNQ